MKGKKMNYVKLVRALITSIIINAKSAKNTSEIIKALEEIKNELK